MKIDRLLGILTVLLNHGRVSAPQLAEKFEVSRRTIGRDVDALCKAGIPIVALQGNGGGIEIAEGFRLDKSVLTADELSGIVAALKGIGSVSENSQIEITLEKLRAKNGAVISLREPVIIDLASHFKEQLTGKIELIKRAILETRLVSFDYYSEKGESRRCIEPYFVVFKWAAWHVFGFCLERRDWRMFKLTRLWDLELCGESYAPCEIPPEKRDFDLSFSDDIKFSALFDPSEKYKLIEAYGLHCYKETDEGLLFEFGFVNRDYLVNWLLGFGGKVKVLEPSYIADEIKAAAEKILSRYE